MKILNKFSSTESFLRFLVWGSLGFIAIIDFVAIKMLGIKLVVGDEQIEVAFGILACALLPVFMHKLAKKSLADGFKRLSFGFKTLAYFLELLASFALFASLFVIFSYIAASSPRPFFDAELMIIDKSIGFDWLAYIAWVNQNPWANSVLKFAYHSSFQIPCLFLFAAFAQQSLRLYSVMLCLIFSVIIVIAISAIFPATSAFTYLHLQQENYPNLYTLPSYAHVADLYKMRGDGENIIDLSNMKGIITFPSFHTSLAIILTWGFWAISWLRVPFLLLNSVMLAAIPVTGGHYLTDMIAGAAIAIMMILLIKKIEKFADARFESVRIENEYHPIR